MWGLWAQTHLGFSYIKAHKDMKVTNLSMNYSFLFPCLPFNDRTSSRSFCIVDWDPLALYFN